MASLFEMRKSYPHFLRIFYPLYFVVDEFKKTNRHFIASLHRHEKNRLSTQTERPGGHSLRFRAPAAKQADEHQRTAERHRPAHRIRPPERKERRRPQRYRAPRCFSVTPCTSTRLQCRPNLPLVIICRGKGRGHGCHPIREYPV